MAHGNHQQGSQGNGNGQDPPTMWIDPQACQGCVLCLKACSAKAIRVRGGVAHILPQACVNCGDCFRACPHLAVRCRTTPLEAMRRFKHPVAAASPTLFSQFGYRTTPNQILLALERLGFQQVMDMGWLCEMNSVAMEEHLLAHPELRPGISPSCPAVIRLIAGRFPSLLGNVLPILPPRVFAGKVVKERLAQSLGWDPREVGVFHIAPCAAKMVGPHDPVVLDQPYVDGVFSFREIYGPLLQALQGLEEDHTLQKCSGAGIAWAMSGGQAAAVDVEHTLDVAGFDEVVRILEMLEAGRLRDLRFLEAHICPDGCLGGPLVVENHYRAKSVTLRQMRRFGAMSRVNRAKIKQFMAEGLYDWRQEASPRPLPPLDPDTSQAIAKMKAIQSLTARLPGIECGVCGSPDCQTFAEDVILGRAREDLCPFTHQRGGPQPAAAGREAMTVKDLVDKLGLTVAAGAAGLDRPVQGGYISDLLSDVMANARPGAVWLTIQAHQNVVAVAVLKELAAVVLVGGRAPAEETAAKADQEAVPVLTASADAFTLAGRLHDLGL